MKKIIVLLICLYSMLSGVEWVEDYGGDYGLTVRNQSNDYMANSGFRAVNDEDEQCYYTITSVAGGSYGQGKVELGANVNNFNFKLPTTGYWTFSRGSRVLYKFTGADILDRRGKKFLHGDDCVDPSHINAIDDPADGEVLGYDSATGYFEWISSGGTWTGGTVTSDILSDDGTQDIGSSGTPFDSLFVGDAVISTTHTDTLKEATTDAGITLGSTMNIGSLIGTPDTYQTLIDMSVTGSLDVDDPVGFAIKIDGNSVLEIRGEDDGGTGAEDFGAVVNGYIEVGGDILASAGTEDIGSSGTPFDSLFVDYLSSVTMTGSILASTGTENIGTALSPFGEVYFSKLDVAGLSQFDGNATFGGNILASAGTEDVGSIGTPFAEGHFTDLYAYDDIFGSDNLYLSGNATKIYLDYDGTAGSYAPGIYFGEDGDYDANQIYWNGGGNRFIMTNNLYVEGTLSADATITTYNGIIRLYDEGSAIYMDYNSIDTEDHDMNIYFGDDEDNDAHWFKWDDGDDSFDFSDDVMIDSTLEVNYNIVSGANITAKGFLATEYNAMYIGYDSATEDEDIFLYFSDDGIDGAHYLAWNDGYDSNAGRFETYDELRVHGNFSAERQYYQYGAAQTASSDSIDVADINWVQVATVFGDVSIGGFQNGIRGQTIYITSELSTPQNDVILLDMEGSGYQDIRTGSGADITLTGVGGAILLYTGVYWQLMGFIK